jgi:hypothetical protein
MVRIFISLLVSRAFAAAPENTAKTEIDQQTNDFISSDLYKSIFGPKFDDVDGFIQSSEFSASDGISSDFFSIDVTEHIARIRQLLEQVPDNREVLTIPNWNAQYKPKLNRALYDFHSDIISRTSSGDSGMGNVVKQLHFFIAVFDAQTVDEILQVKGKILRDLELIGSLRMSGHFTEDRPRQLASFIAYAEHKLNSISENCQLAKSSTEATEIYKFETLSSVLAIARGLEFFAPACDLGTFRDMISSLRVLDFKFVSLYSPYFIHQTLSTVGQLQAIFRECTSRL